MRPHRVLFSIFLLEIRSPRLFSQSLTTFSQASAMDKGSKPDHRLEGDWLGGSSINWTIREASLSGSIGFISFQLPLGDLRVFSNGFGYLPTRAKMIHRRTIFDFYQPRILAVVTGKSSGLPDSVR